MFYTAKATEFRREFPKTASSTLTVRRFSITRLASKIKKKPLKSAISLAEMLGIVDKMVYSRIASDGAIRNLGHFAKDVHLRASHQHRLMRDEEDAHNALALGDYEAIEGQLSHGLKDTAMSFLWRPQSSGRMCLYLQRLCPESISLKGSGSRGNSQMKPKLLHIGESIESASELLIAHHLNEVRGAS